MKRITLLFIAAFSLFSDSCRKNDQSESVIEPDFQEYVDRFVNEADLRNIKIDISKLKVSYGDTLKYYCGYGGVPNEVIINSACWENFTDIKKELLIFHEFGHAILGRRIHDNSKLPNGDFKTIMSTSYAVYEFSPEKRKYYLDELFDQSTPPPNWAAIKTIPTIIFKDTIQSGSSLWKFVNGPGNTSIGKFCSTQFFSEGTSLSIEPSNSIQGWAYWNLDYIPEGINQSDKLELSARIKTVGVPYEGGVTLLMRGFNSNNDMVFFTFVWVPGWSTDFSAEWKAEVPYYVSATKISIRFVFGDNPGIAYLDDLTLTKYVS